jgi:menaquinone-dependent protoporphyrinogen oxidase
MEVSMTKVLVTYASKHHATAEIADVIGKVLRRFDGLQVDVKDAETIKNIAPYEVIVVGSAVYAGHWQPTAVNFLKQNIEALAEKFVWVFSSGPTGEGDPKALMKGWEFPEGLRPLIEQIKPQDVTVFHGKLDPDSLNVFERFVVKGIKAPLGDYRDWEAIRDWALAIGHALVPGHEEPLSLQPE